VNPPSSPLTISLSSLQSDSPVSTSMTPSLNTLISYSLLKPSILMAPKRPLPSILSPAIAIHGTKLALPSEQPTIDLALKTGSAYQPIKLLSFRASIPRLLLNMRKLQFRTVQSVLVITAPALLPPSSTALFKVVAR
jgi:hypothetical protein